jgi:putative membrane protein
MIRLAATAVVSLLADAIALVVTAQALDDMSLDVSGLIVAVGLFAVTGLLVEPLLRQAAIRSAPALLGSTALVATLVSLVVTALVGDGLQISGAVTWVLATVLVWALALAARLLLPLLIFKKVLAEPSGSRAAAA